MLSAETMTVDQDPQMFTMEKSKRYFYREDGTSRNKMLLKRHMTRKNKNIELVDGIEAKLGGDELKFKTDKVTWNGEQRYIDL